MAGTNTVLPTAFPSIVSQNGYSNPRDVYWPIDASGPGDYCTIISSLLITFTSIALVASLGIRGGDVALSRSYNGEECMQWRHMELFIDGDKATFSNSRAKIALELLKGSKDVKIRRRLSGCDR